mmetsp:Transcript_18040/g.52034  ORF Transcript_18040/g.52034 Transcript_18040/m.52034 type:complete len:202 (+) Transcript_18040:722-1327(+)
MLNGIELVAPPAPEPRSNGSSGDSGVRHDAVEGMRAAASSTMALAALTAAAAMRSTWANSSAMSGGKRPGPSCGTASSRASVDGSGSAAPPSSKAKGVRSSWPSSRPPPRRLRRPRAWRWRASCRASPGWPPRLAACCRRRPGRRGATALREGRRCCAPPWPWGRASGGWLPGDSPCPQATSGPRSAARPASTARRRRSFR